MKILLRLISKDNNCTISELYINSKHHCYVVEDAIRDVKIKDKTAIPAGVYKIGKRHSPRFSPKFNHDMLWLLDVPNYQYVLIHWGNTQYDTSGCLIVGDKIGIIGNEKAVLNSVKTYLKLYPIVSNALDNGEEVTIEITR